MSAKKAPTKPPQDAAPAITTGLAEKLRNANLSNLVRKVKAGKTLSAAELKQIDEASKAPDDPNLSGIARQYNISRTTLIRWRDQGLDLADDAAVAAKVASSKAAPSGDEKDTKLRKLTAEANILEHKLAVQRGEYVSAEDVKNEGLRIAAAVKGVFLRMPDDLPPQLAGHTAAEVKKRLKKYALEKLTELSTYRSPVKIEP